MFSARSALQPVMRLSVLRRFVAGSLLSLVAACHGGASTPAPAELGSTHAAPATPPVPAPAVAEAKPEPLSPNETTKPTPPPAAPAAPEGADFIADAKLLYRVAACGNAEAPLPDELTHGDGKLEPIVAAHCKTILPKLAEFRATYFEKGRAWFDKVVPKDVPRTVVYPFGGGDLLSALVAFPDATEITTISLEQAGDPRRLRTLAPQAIETSLGALRLEIGGLISVGSNTSENLSNQQRNELPGQVSSFLLGLVAGGYEPVAMRYFSLDDTGAIHYLTQAEIDDLDGKARGGQGKSLKHDWLSPNFSQAFANVEIQYKKPGDDQVRVHRHIGWNLNDPYLAKHGELIRHLEKKGPVTVLVKGASYLLYRGDFSTMRNYLLDHLAWMLSDSTGIPPTFAKPAGMVQETYGHFEGAFLETARDNKQDDSFVELWKSQKARRLPFRFGYVDMNKQAHLVVTRPKKKSAD